MAKCKVHPGRDEAVKYGGAAYCKQCKQDIAAAGKTVDKHVSPRECFVWYKDSKTGWASMPDTGCAHYCAHTLGVKKGLGCLQGYSVRTRDVVKGKTAVKDVARVTKGMLWANDKLSHCGIVDAVKAAKGKSPAIKIKHSSSKLGKLAVSEWATYFKSGGTFYK